MQQLTNPRPFVTEVEKGCPDGATAGATAAAGCPDGAATGAAGSPDGATADRAGCGRRAHGGELGADINAAIY